jgi:DNA invertase Pin-like site-specific DNA recombinase
MQGGQGLVIGYIRVSSEQQDVRNQRHEILEYVNHQNLHVDRFIEVEMTSRRNLKDRRITELVDGLSARDILIVSELSRLGRSVVEVISLVNELMKRGIRTIAIKQNLDLKGNHDMQSKVLVTIFSLLAELERDLVSERTRRALAAKRAQGVALGRPAGSIGKSKLDTKISEIVDLLRDKASYSFMARRFKVSRPTIMNFIKSRNLSAM